MTNVTVTNAYKGVDGRNLDLSIAAAREEDRHPRWRPDCNFRRGDPADLKPGVAVFVPAQNGDDGELAAASL